MQQLISREISLDVTHNWQLQDYFVSVCIVYCYYLHFYSDYSKGPHENGLVLHEVDPFYYQLLWMVNKGGWYLIQFGRVKGEEFDF